jgi:hypothetical protein
MPIYYRSQEFFSCKPVIPAKAGIQNVFAKETGCPPGAGMTVKLPYISSVYKAVASSGLQFTSKCFKSGFQ